MISKKLVIGTLLVLSTSAAHAWGPQEQGALLGGALGYLLGSQNNRPNYAEPVYVQPAPVYVYPQNYVQPTPAYQPRPVYEETMRYSPNCNCFVKVIRQTGWQ